MDPGPIAIIVVGSIVAASLLGVFGVKAYNIAHDKKMSATSNGKNKTKSWASFGGRKTRSYRASRSRKSLKSKK